MTIFILIVLLALLPFAVWFVSDMAIEIAVLTTALAKERERHYEAERALQLELAEQQYTEQVRSHNVRERLARLEGSLAKEASPAHTQRVASSLWRKAQRHQYKISGL